MKIKITALVMILIMSLNIGAFAAFNDIDTGSKVGNAILQLSNMGIINGFGDGSFRPDEPLTRAQFAKIAVCMLDEEKNAASRSANTVFNDVPASHWASGYVNYIAEKQIINGYPDGRFGVNENITYAQALTILVRILGYRGEDVAYNWPDGYITKAKALGITENMSFGNYENVTRGNAAYIVYNTLHVDETSRGGNGQSSGEAGKNTSSGLLVGSNRIENVVIYADWNTTASIPGNHVLTTSGTFELASENAIGTDIYGREGTIYFDSEGRITTFVPENETVRKITILGAIKSSDSGRIEITFTEDGATKTDSFDGQAKVYYEGRTGTLETLVEELETGRSALLFYAQNGAFGRMYLNESTLSGPQTVTADYKQVYSLFNIEDKNTLSVIRDGKKATLADIKLYDVIYYVAGNNTLYVYTDKVNGTYEEAYPIKSGVTSVKVTGREYNLATQKAINKMNSSEGAFELGERVTLLLGRTGEVVDVVDMTKGSNLDLVVLTKSYSAISQDRDTQGQTIRYVDVVLPNGNQVTYEADDDYTDYVGNVMRVEYENEVASLTAVKHSTIYGKFDSSVPSLNGHWLTSDCAVLELVSNTTQGATVKKIEVDDIITDNLTQNHVLHAETTGDMKDISFLYVTDITKSDASFGVVTEISGSSHTILVGDKNTSIRTALNLSRGAAVEIEETTDGTKVRSLVNIGSGNSVEGYSGGRIRVGKQTFLVSDYVKVYGGVYASDYHSMSVAEIIGNPDVQQVTVYSDRTLASGGIVRVIVVRTKK